LAWFQHKINLKFLYLKNATEFYTDPLVCPEKLTYFVLLYFSLKYFVALTSKIKHNLIEQK